MGRLATVTLVATIALVGLGGYTRGSGSGYGCADRWPLCEGGLLGGLLPTADRHMIVEWSHRWLAATVGTLALATTVAAWSRVRARREVVVPVTAALAVVGIQAWVGRLIVTNNLDADLVSLHLGISMAIVGLLSATVTSTRLPVDPAAWGGTGRRVAILTSAAAGIYVVILLGSFVHNQTFPGWPLMDNTLIPVLDDLYRTVHFIHRVVAGIGIVVLSGLCVEAFRRPLPPAERVLVVTAASCYAVNVLLGMVHVVTKVGWPSVVVLHLTVAAVAWACLVALSVTTFRRYRASRVG